VNSNVKQKKDMPMPAGPPNPEADAAPAARGEDKTTIRVVWNDSQMQTSYANVMNVLMTREEFTLLFGTNQSWNLAEGGELKVLLSNRIVLTPHAAKRLLTLLSQRVEEYESRFSKMSVGA
jgi:Protein of unknown function (DUF3467)